MLEYRRYREAGEVLEKMFEREGGVMYRSAPPPAELRRAAVKAAVKAYEPDRLGSALGDLLTLPPDPDTQHIRTTVSLQRRLVVVRELLTKGKTIDFDEAFGERGPLHPGRDAVRAAGAPPPRRGDLDAEGHLRADRGDGQLSATAGRASRRCCSGSPIRSRAAELAEAIEVDEEPVAEAARGAGGRARGLDRGLRLRKVAGGYALAAVPDAEDAARRLLSKPRTPPLTQAQAEVLAIVAYLQPVSRPEVARIRGVSSDSAVASLTERGMIEESGRTQFGAVTYATTTLFEKLFGLSGLDALPDPAQFDPTPEDERELRERLLKAGEQRAE